MKKPSATSPTQALWSAGVQYCTLPAIGRASFTSGRASGSAGDAKSAFFTRAERTFAFAGSAGGHGCRSMSSSMWPSTAIETCVFA